jgi:hypothetical protein
MIEPRYERAGGGHWHDIRARPAHGSADHGLRAVTSVLRVAYDLRAT